MTFEIIKNKGYKSIITHKEYEPLGKYLLSSKHPTTTILSELTYDV